MLTYIHIYTCCAHG